MRYSKRRALTYEQALALSQSELDRCVDLDSKLPVDARNENVAAAWINRYGEPKFKVISAEEVPKK